MDFTSAEEFLGAAMEKAAACTECEQCVERCPYDLPIPDLLKEKRRVYEEAVREHK
jgi:predicted aldo/keto reductase-like oxidoreductase